MLLSGFGFSSHARDYAASSVLKEGKWVKINIKEEGMQILTPAAMKQMGFSDPSKVHVYGYGGYRLSETLTDATPDDLPIQPVVRTADGSIISYGAGLVEWQTASNPLGFTHYQNVYSTIAPYFLSDREASDPAPEPLTTPIGSSARPVTTFTHLMLHEQELATPANTGADLLGEDFRSTSQRTFSFPVTDPASDKINFRLFFGSKASGTATLTMTSGGATLPVASLPAETNSVIHYRNYGFDRTATLTDKPTADLTLKFSGGGIVTTARLDYIEAAYTRSLKLNGGLLQFRHTASGSQVLCIEGCSASTLIWDVTDPAAPRQVAYELQGSTARFAPTPGTLRTYIAFNPASVKTAPASLGSVSAQDIHSMETPDMVIITPDAYKAQAERLAEFHRTNDNMVVHVLIPENIYNEFSSGKPDATAFRKMLKMFYDRGKSGERTLKHALLFGRPSYDHRLIAEIPAMAAYPRLLTWESTMSTANLKESTVSKLDNTTTVHEEASYCTDSYFAMLEDSPYSFNLGTALLSIGIGRMPVKSLQEAKTAVDKVIGYMTDPDFGAWRSHVMLIADDADSGKHLEQTEAMYSIMQDENNGNGRDFIYEKLYLDSYPLGSGGNSKTYPQAKERMFKMFEEGVSFVSYVGHANPTSWTHESLMTYSDINSLTYKHLPIIYHASCEFIRFDDDTQSGAETMWLYPQSGAIAFIAANRKVYVEQNGYLTKRIGKFIFAQNPDGTPLTIGDVFRLAMNDLGSSKENSSNKNRYALMGDPAMRIPSPSRKIKIEKIGETDLAQAVADENLPVVPARSKMKVSGQVLLPDGSVDVSFNGTLTATLFDAERAVTTYGHPSEGKNDGKVSIYNDRKNRLALASFPVKEGKWEATLYLPEEIDENYSPALLSLYACTSDGKEAIGSTSDFYVYGYDESGPEDNEAPEISLAAIGTPGFRPGDIVAPSTSFLAKVRDDSGINISSSGIGKQMTIVIDGKKIYDDVSDYFTTDPEDPTAGSVTYPIDGLDEGEHELAFQVFDNAGNCAKVTLPFKVGGSMQPNVDLRTDASPASTQATIYVTTARQPQEAVIEVFDMAGRKVWSAVPEQLTQSMNVTWDLCDSSGRRVPRGIYLYSAKVLNPDGTTHRRTRKIAVTAE